MTEPIAPTPIGVARGGRSQIHEDHRGAAVARLLLDPRVLDQAATDGLSEFSHIEVVFHFHQETRVRRDAAHPRGNLAWPPVGVLAGHSPVRPNHLGVSVCALLEVAGLEFTDDQQKDIFAHFIKGADLTAGGVMHAVTSAAQTLDDADASYDMEAQGLKAMEIAASL